jgi:hypothetical protein
MFKRPDIDKMSLPIARATVTVFQLFNAVVLEKKNFQDTVKDPNYQCAKTDSSALIENADEISAYIINTIIKQVDAISSYVASCEMHHILDLGIKASLLSQYVEHDHFDH